MINYEFEIDSRWCQVNSEFAKALSFVSEYLTHYVLAEGRVKLFLEDHENAELSRLNFIRLIEQFKKNSDDREDHIYEHSGKGQFFDHYAINDSEMIHNFGDGLIGLEGPALKLLEFFDHTFRSFAVDLGATEKQYPVLLPMGAMEKTGYLRTSPQYSMLVSNVRENMDCLSQLTHSLREGSIAQKLSNPGFVLSPAACFHCYMDMEGQKLETSQVITLRQHVFRHEGSLNWGQYGRLRDYQVREVVFVGSSDFVIDKRNRLIDITKQWIEKIGLTARLSITHDPFVIPEMQKFKKIQRLEQSKIELQLAIDSQRYMACSSFNLHGKAFTDSFHFSVRGNEETVTGCVGFGLERWVLAFLSQFGTDVNNWPLKHMEIL
jgi:seryl-tRNA synthetase